MAVSTIKKVLATTTRTVTTNLNGYVYWGTVNDEPHIISAYTATGVSAVCLPFIQNGAIYIKCEKWDGTIYPNQEFTITVNYM